MIAQTVWTGALDRAHPRAAGLLLIVLLSGLTACSGPAVAPEASGQSASTASTGLSLSMLSPAYAALPTRALATIEPVEGDVGVTVLSASGEILASSPTDGSGRAFLSWTWPEPNAYQVQAQGQTDTTAEQVTPTLSVTAAAPEPPGTPQTRGDDNAGVFEAGGQRQWLDCRGTGGPTLVLIAGLWGWSKDWVSMTDQLRAGGRVCTYDRPGLGQSPARTGSLEVDASLHAMELHELLRVAGEEGPYLIVGHSYGGLVARSFNNNHPQSAAGMTLLDPVPALFNSTVPSYNSTFAEANPETTIDLERSGEAAGGTMPLVGLPLIVMAAGLPQGGLSLEGWALWLEAQRSTAAASDNSQFLVAPDAAHQLQDTATDLALAAVEETRSSIREHRLIAVPPTLEPALPSPTIG